MNEPDATIDHPSLTEPAADKLVPSLDSAARLASILDRCMADLKAGVAFDRARLIAAHPELAERLDACLAGIEFIHNATAAAPETLTNLGEFRIIRELGRGGMGVVYEAEQTSLRRHVALKVLRFGAVADEDAMNRFRREAETVARLHHTNIVPIFAVGCEQGVNYYAMQFIEGRSLAELLAESQRTGDPAPAEDVARWGLQAAEALTHAHQRGVIHRDIKPSNLLLDADGVVWLTDFGLAKRMDEATLTVHGTLMGTPRYMSPEQAASLQQPVDRRTDVYSLGATLYELATGRALFQSAHPHLVIAQILTEEPARPRQIRPALSVDIETVILKCLAEEPSRRYQSAQELTSDLRAVLEGRPIQARRTPAVERIVRYVRQRRKTLTGAGLAAAATVLLMIGLLGAWRYYSEWRLGRIVLATDGPSLAAEVLPASSGDRRIGEPFDVATRTVLTLPADDYRLRVKATGLMSQTYRFAVNRGETRTHRLTLDDDGMLGSEPIPFSLVTEAVMLTPGKADLIEWNGDTLIRRNGTTGRPIWDVARPARPWDPKIDPVAWMRRLSRGGDEKRPGQLVQPAPDLDGDGTGDLIWAFKGTPSLLALAGKDGSLLWTYSADPGAELHPGKIMGAPAVADVDRDGAADLIAELVILDDPEALIRRSREPAGWNEKAETVLAGRRMVVALSGRSGKPLWNYLVDRKLTDLPAEALDHGIRYTSQAKGSFVAVMDGSKWISLDPATGRLRGPSIELGFSPVLPIQYADLDGDGSAEILALEPNMDFEPLTDPSLVAFSMATRERLWVKKNLMTFYRPMPAVPVRDWPVAADLDGDGRAEIVVPHVGAVGQGVQMLDGATGETRWDCPLWPSMKFAYDSLVHLLAGPDIDADGTSDLVVVSQFRDPDKKAIAGQTPEQTWAYVDAVSGKDGRRIWHWRTEINFWDTTPNGPAFWWGRGSDSWPMLVVPVGGDLAPGVTPPRFYPFSSPDQPVVHFLAAATGHEEHSITGLSWPKTADLDGDGWIDLWGSVENKLCAYRGRPSEAWRVIDRLHADSDFDGDGMTDVLSNDLETLRTGLAETMESRTVIARSGRDGRILWRTLLDPWDDWVFPWGWKRAYGFHSVPLPCGDLDGDGSPDVLVSRTSNGSAPDKRWPVHLPMQALSGRTGPLLWPAGPLPPLELRPSGNPVIEASDVLACGHRGLPDVLALYDLFFEKVPIRFDTQSRLARLSGHDGRVVWDVLLMEHLAGGDRRMGFVHEVADLDGDGGLEIVLLLRSFATSGPRPRELRVLSLGNGATRWRHQLQEGAATSPAFAIGDMDGDGRPEVVVSQLMYQNGQGSIEVTALDGHSGEPRWSWRGGKALDWSDNNLLLCLAAFDGSGRKEVCVNFGRLEGRRRAVILDVEGRERIRRDLEPVCVATLRSVDLDGDGRDELLFHDGGRLRACRGNLTEQWSWPTRDTIHEVIPASAGRPATGVVNPSLALDGATGRPVWSGGPARSILRSSDDHKLPRMLTGPDGSTVCRVAMPISIEGTFRAPQGMPAKPAALRDDPRWERPLPWVRPVEPYADPLVQAALAATLINVCIPLAILRLATRRRFWGVRLLLAIPAVFAIVLTGYPAVTSLTLDRPEATLPRWWYISVDAILFTMCGLPIVVYVTAFVLSLVRQRWLKRLLALPVVAAILVAGHSALVWLIPDHAQPTELPWWTTPLEVTLLSMSGLPIVAYAAARALSVVRRRWRSTRILVAGALHAACLIAAMSLRFDRLMMLAIEHYDWSGWHQAILWGAYAVGLLVLLARPAQGIARFVSRLAYGHRVAISTSGGM
jgi:serine/threonine protein kinase